ncbi:MAG: zinc ribbon domain-containing protein [Candidatus Bathyarchaeota archaeon]|nr:zinc ribbon domain-containing protein [Candidatus Bathyarchaeota archaeon]
MNCPKCGNDNPSDNKFCDNCGSELVSTVAAPTPVSTGGIECSACKAANPIGSAFCESCGASLESASAPIAAPVAPQPTFAPPQAQFALVCPDGTEISISSSKTIGRLDLAKYAAPNETMWISRQHFDILEENGAPFIIDEKSANGTKLNGKEIKQQGKQQLKSDDEIIVGDAVKLVFKIK